MTPPHRDNTSAEASARHSEEERALLDTLINSAPIGVALLDHELRFLRINAHLAELNGLPVEAHLGRTFREVLPELAAAAEPLLRQVLATGAPILDLELVGETPAQPGKTRIWRESFYPVRSLDGRLFGVGAIAREITEFRRLRQTIDRQTEQLRLNEEQLHRALLDTMVRTEQLSAKTAELERANARLALEIAERERVEDALRQSRDELVIQLAVSQQLMDTLGLFPLLDRILEQLERLEGFDAASILLLEGDDVMVGAYRGAFNQAHVRGSRLNLEHASILRALINTQQPLVITDLAGDTAELASLERVLGERRVLRAWLGVPLLVRERVLAILSLASHAAGTYGAHAQNRVQLFANQIALAIENARLYEHAREVAVSEERLRIARDLQDAVSQTLFSASLIAEALPEAVQRAPEKAQRGADELRELTRGALSEMRTLLYELRPVALSEKPLSELLGSLSAAFTRRMRIPVEFVLERPCVLQPEHVQLVFYRGVQEALTNVWKYAGATAVTVRLVSAMGRVDVAVTDDGRGFDLTATESHMGALGSLRERAEAIGAVLQIVSQPGAGTTVRLSWGPAGNVRSATGD
ncbi:MAG: PAS domain-containing protein [Chloroflexales bacterium]|nr:PAS domain-containing protein [Chloroflexales bacterium]